jgi:hypothetical protein
MQTFLLNLLIFPIPVTFQPYINIPVLTQFHAAKPVLISPLLGRIEHGCINTTVTIQTAFYKNMHISIYLKRLKTICGKTNREIGLKEKQSIYSIVSVVVSNIF